MRDFPCRRVFEVSQMDLDYHQMFEALVNIKDIALTYK